MFGSAGRFFGAAWRWVDRSRCAPRPPALLCRADEHEWERVSTVVVPGKPLIVEYRCLRCASWTVEEARTW